MLLLYSSIISNRLSKRPHLECDPSKEIKKKFWNNRFLEVYITIIIKIKLQKCAFCINNKENLKLYLKRIIF